MLDDELKILCELHGITINPWLSANFTCGFSKGDEYITITDKLTKIRNMFKRNLEGISVMVNNTDEMVELSVIINHLNLNGSKPLFPA